MNYPEKPTAHDVFQAATAAWDTYKDDREGRFEHVRTIRPFWLVGDLVACVRREPSTRTAYVAIRGTSEIGNWIFTNFQAYYTKLRVVDDDLQCEYSDFQGGRLRTPAPGKVHQGFVRASSLLWYGSEPVFGMREFDRTSALRQLLKYVIIFFGIPLAWWGSSLAGHPIAAERSMLYLCVMAAFIAICVENGVFADLFLRDASLPETPLRELVRASSEGCDRVVFTGHSLGGSIATILFLIYRRSLARQASAHTDVALVTFGSARTGDRAFVEAFEREFESCVVHIQHPGDPVPQIPPNGWNELMAHRFFARGLLGVLLTLTFLPWTLYKYVYMVSRPARWSSRVTDNMGERPYRRLSPSFHNMEKTYLRYARMKLDESHDLL